MEAASTPSSPAPAPGARYSSALRVATTITLVLSLAGLVLCNDITTTAFPQVLRAQELVTAAAAAATADRPRFPVSTALAFHPPCNFTVARLDPACPRFTRIAPLTIRGIGDRFLQYLVPYLIALDADAVPFPIHDAFVDTAGRHGSYPWAKDFFHFNDQLPFSNASAALAAFPDLRVIRLAAQGDYNARINSVKGECGVIIEVDMQTCEGGCYFASKPNYQRLRHVMACNIMRNKGQSRLPPLVFGKAGAEAEEDAYVVAIHLRRGDKVLHGDEGTGAAYFTRLRAQIDEVLQDFPAVHYYFITEGEDLQEDEPPFPFLAQVFTEDDRIKTTYLNHLDPRAALYHMMNADMLVTTGSSFPYVALTLSPKPVVLFGRPKENTFFTSYLRDDFVLVENDGGIIGQTLGEVTALVAIRYEEVHGRSFPYRRRRRLGGGGRSSSGSRQRHRRLRTASPPDAV